MVEFRSFSPENARRLQTFVRPACWQTDVAISIGGSYGVGLRRRYSGDGEFPLGSFAVSSREKDAGLLAHPLL